MTAVRTRDTSGYGYIPDLPDHRDHPLTLPSTTLPRPDSFHLNVLSAMQFPIYDQGNLGSCVGNATAAAMQYLFRKESLPNVTPSRLAIYYDARKIEGSVNSDSGCMIRDAIKVVAKAGAGPETLCPYDIKAFKKMPSARYYTAAAKRQAVEYQRVDQTEEAIKSTLAAGFPIVYGISVYESFESDAVAQTGIVPMPDPSEDLLGGHATLLTGYDPTTFTARNSWGPKWGQKGYYVIPLAYVLNPDLAEDFWAIKLVER